MTVKPEYGVPPYKISHPWDTTHRIYTVGAYSSCNSTGTTTATLTIPGCPTYCNGGNNDTIQIPAPLVIDACGDTAKGWPAEKIILKPTPKVNATPDTLSVCNGAPFNFPLNSCVPGTTFTWTGANGSSGSGNIINAAFDTSRTNPYKVVYTFSGSANGCSSAVDTAIGIVNPYPVVVITGKDTIPVSTSTVLTASGGNSYLWEPAAGLSCTTCQSPTAAPAVTTVYLVTVTDKEGCSWVDSVRVVVLDNQIVVPNVITPNGDNINDYLSIKGLQYYPNSSLYIYDRWGKQVYQTSNYLNNWDGGGQSDGVYYYVLTLSTTGKKYKGFFQLIK
jgi:gliding motility-associated-like protein